jgi:hypothetical protein
MQQGAGTYPFVVVLRNGHAKAVRTTGIILGIIAVCLLGFRQFSAEGTGSDLIILFPVAILLIWNILRIRNNKPASFRTMLLLTGLGLILVPPFNWIGFLFLLTAGIESYALKPQEIGFGMDHVKFSGPGGRQHAWSEFSNVMLKDGLLTLDFTNNRLFQKETDDTDDEDYDGTEQEFNEFCAARIAASRKPQ